MKLLIVADFHFRKDWFVWLSKRKVDLVLMAGDMLNGFDESGILHQMIEFEKWCKTFPLPLAICSGNHDANSPDGAWGQADEMAELDYEQREMAGKMMTASRWMDVVERDGVVTDSRSNVMITKSGQVVVTSIPFDFGYDRTNPDQLWRTGAELRKRLRLPWIVLHHDPPADTAVGGRNGDPHLFYQIQSYRPDFVVSGHAHAQPYHGDFIDRLDDTWCLNPGRPRDSQCEGDIIPNHIVLDLKARTALWYATPATGKTPIQKTRSLA